ncbi:aldehyde dehydrogenase [Jackrogersella minutella]|nr:aldehyde dehydrogenase [Jackrogersella minutella]
MARIVQVRVMNPISGKTNYDCASASVGDYARAIPCASLSFNSWSRTSPSSRRLIFLKAAGILEGYLNCDAPAILSAEVSATTSWIQVNIVATVGILRETAGLGTHIKGDIVPADRPGTTILIEREPLGVVFAISPWNAPCVPSMLRDYHQAVSISYSYRLIGRQLSPSRIIAGWAATCLKRCVLELGGKAPVIVLNDANPDDAVEAVVFGALANAGQICMSTERVLLHDAVAEPFKQALLRRIEDIKVGNHEDDPEISMSGLFSSASAKRVQALLGSAVSSGAKLLHGDISTSGPNNTILSPHALDGVTPDMEILHKESFGPVISFCSFNTDEEAIGLANSTDFSLYATVFLQDMMRALDIARKVKEGSCHVNGPTVYINYST